MPAQFPGSSNKTTPDVYVEVETINRGVSIPSGTRLAALMGEGRRQFTIIPNANGNGNDGLNSTFTSTTGANGRYFSLNAAPVIENRTTIYKNGIPLNLLEAPITGPTFDNRYDVRFDPSNGHLQLQSAQLVDQGGAYFSSSATNTGNGKIQNLTLVDDDAPTESWTIRCVSVRRDGYGDPIDGYARFIARGSRSGIILDGYGNQIVWQSNGSTVSNTILQFSIIEGGNAFVEGDTFVVRVKGGALVAGDSLSANFIAVADINDVDFFQDMNAIAAKHGRASAQNRLTLGAQVMFANSPPGCYTIQCAPALPRRINYSLTTDANGTSTIDDLSFPLPLGVVPDSDSNINFFVTNPTTGIETQVIPNKVDFYDPTISSNPSAWAFGPNTYSYTVILEDSIQKSAINGVLTSTGPTSATLSSTTLGFNLEDLAGTRSLYIYDALNSANNGTAAITSVSNGVATINKGGGFVTESSIRFEVRDSSVQSASIIFTDDLTLAAGSQLRATLVDEKDADFFDAGWVNAYEALEKIELDMVVPLPSQTISAIFQNGKAHVMSQSNILNRHERILFIGAIQGLTPENVVGTEPAAVEDLGTLEGIQGDSVTEVLAGDTEDLADYGVQNAYGDTFRVVYFYPDSIVVQVGADRLAVDGFFIGCAAAGYFAANTNINVPLTNKVLSGFTILRDKLFSPLVLGNLVAAGITVFQPVIGGGRCIWGKTTTLSNAAEEQEISIVFIRDRIAKALRETFKPFIGQAETPTFVNTLYATATDACNAFINQRWITQFAQLVVQRDPVEPRQFNISVAIQPTYPVNWIFIKVGIGLLDAT